MLQEQDEAKKKDKKTMCKQTRNSREKEFVKKKKECIETFGVEKLNGKFKIQSNYSNIDLSRYEKALVNLKAT